MHLFFNDPRIAYVTRHRRILRHPLVMLVAGGVGVAALGVAIGAAGWEPPQQGSPAPQSAAQQGMAMPDPVQDVNLYGVPAAPQPVLPSETLAPPAKQPVAAKTDAKGIAKTKTQVKQVEKIKVPRRPAAKPTSAPPATQDPAQDPTPEPTQEPTHEPTQEPTHEPTHEPTQEPTQEPTMQLTAQSADPGEQTPAAEPVVQP